VSDHSIFLVCFNLMREADLMRVDYWLHSLGSLGESKCPIVVVGTHLDDPTCTKKHVDAVFAKLRKKYTRRFRNIKGYVAVSSKNYKGVRELVSQLVSVARQEKLVGQRVPNSYLLLIKHLQMDKAKRPVISWSEFQKMARRFDVDLKNVEEVALFLHRTGHIQYYGDEFRLRDHVFLDPQFLADVFSTVVTMKLTLQNGRLRHPQLQLIWREYDSALHPIMLTILEKFEIIFRLPDEPDEDGVNVAVSLVPSLITNEADPAVLKHWPDGDSAWLRDGYLPRQRVYLFKFLPVGFFGRVIVRTLHIRGVTVDQYWRDGVLVSQGRSKALLLFEQGRQLRVRMLLDEEQPGNLEVSVFHSLDSLLYGWEYASFLDRVEVSCWRCLRDRVDPPVRVLRRDCTLAVARNEAAVHCGEHGLLPVDQWAPEVALRYLDRLRTPIELVELGEELARGTGTVVYRAQHKVTGAALAVKEFQLDEDVTQSDILEKFELFRREVILTAGLQHPNVVGLSGFCVHNNRFYMLSPFIHNGDLAHLLRKNDAVHLDWPLRLKIAADMVQGMLALHNANPPIVHRDVKSPNVLMQSFDAEAPVVARIADFGLSDIGAISRGRERAVMCPNWLAPEAMREQGGENTKRSDVYSFGIMLWELYTRQFPFGEYKCKFEWQLEKRILTEDVRPTIPKDCPPVWRALIEDCWNSLPEKRPTFAQIQERLHRIEQELLGSVRYTLVPEVVRKALAQQRAHASSPTGKRGSSSKSPKKRSGSGKGKRAASASALQDSPGSPLADEHHYATTELAEKLVTLQPSAADGVHPQCLCVQLHTSQLWIGLSDGGLQVWDARTHKRLSTPKGHAAPVSALSPVGEAQVWSGDEAGQLLVWSASTLKKTSPLRKVKLGLCCAALLALRGDGGRAVWAVSGDSSLAVLEVESARVTHELELSSVGPLTALVEHKDMVFAACSKNIFQFQWATRAQQDILCGHQALVTDLCAREDMLYSASRDRTVRGWKANSEGVFEQACLLEGHHLPVLVVRAIGSYLWTASEDATLQVWDPTPAPRLSKLFFTGTHSSVDAPRLIDTYKPHANAVVALAVRAADDEHSEVWTGSWDGQVSVFRTQNRLPDCASSAFDARLDGRPAFDFLDYCVGEPLDLGDGFSSAKRSSSSSSKRKSSSSSSRKRLGSGGNSNNSSSSSLDTSGGSSSSRSKSKSKSKSRSSSSLRRNGNLLRKSGESSRSSDSLKSGDSNKSGRGARSKKSSSSSGVSSSSSSAKKKK
jgi:Protein tyrosine and serine/threonine kinase/C-terminal of Roc, COR, domain/WD domain, G-beta repeat